MSGSTTSLVLFFLASGLILYVLFGYPLLLALLARRHHRPILRHYHPRTVSVLLPVRNGERWISAKLHSIATLNYPPELMEILVVSDGSTDSTENLVRSFPDPRIRLFSVPPGGKATALNTALAAAQGEILFFTDVRQQLEPDCLRHLVACFADPSVGVVSGELIIRDGLTSQEKNVGLYWRYEKWIRKHLSQIDSILGATGCIYAMRRSLAKPLPPGTLLDDVYLPLAAFFAGYRVVFEPNARAYDLPTSLPSEFHRKVRTQAGIYQLLRYYPQLLSWRNRMWIHFVSHKLGRLALPFLLLALAGATPGLPHPWNWSAGGAQILFYSLALFDPFLAEHSRLKKITAPIHTFVVLTAAALCALSILFRRHSQSFWKPTEVNPAAPMSQSSQQRSR